MSPHSPKVNRSAGPAPGFGSGSQALTTPVMTARPRRTAAITTGGFAISRGCRGGSPSARQLAMSAVVREFGHDLPGRADLRRPLPRHRPALPAAGQSGLRARAVPGRRLPGGARAALAAVSPGALLFGTALPSTRARRPFQPADIDLVVETLGEENARRALYDNAMALYRPRRA